MQRRHAASDGAIAARRAGGAVSAPTVTAVADRLDAASLEAGFAPSPGA